MNSCPLVSIVIPTFNRLDALRNTLFVLSKVDYPKDRWEVVVADDGGKDGTEAAVRAYAETSGSPIRCVRQENQGPAAARNLGARHARGEILIFIDDDILVAPDFVNRHVAALTGSPRSWVIGYIAHPEEVRRTPFGRYRASLADFFQGEATERTETTAMTAANLSLPTADFHDLGGFDEQFPIASCEDDELALRARKRGIRTLYDPGIAVLHNDWAVALPQFCERQRLYAIAHVLLFHKYGEASPRARVVAENAPVDLRRDPAGVMAKKMIKRVLAPFLPLIQTGCRGIEALAPDSRLSHRAYSLAIALSVFRGVRHGVRRYGWPRLESGVAPGAPVA